MFLHQKMNFLIMFIIFLLSKTRAQNNNTICFNHCGDQIVDYPFGFSDGCGIKLNCIDDKVQIDEFLIQNMTKNSILIYLPAKCNRSIQSIQPLFSDNFAPTRNNSFLVQDCSAPLGGCVIPASSFVGNQIEVESCDRKSSNISCFNQQYHEGDVDVLSYEELNKTRCNNLFSAVAVEQSKEISLQFQAIELAWWVKGSCQCSNNATCSNVTLQGNGSGFRCQCLDGFRGDGFANGTGCRRAPGCSASTLTSGGCGSATKIGVVVAVSVTGVVIVAALIILCFCARRRFTWLRKHTRVKRLLREAAGNSIVPLYSYKDIERATNSFSDKQRLGTGAFDEIVDPFLEPNRDAWTLYSINKVAELAFRCLAFHSDMRPTMMEVAEELEYIRRRAWATMEETICLGSSIGSASSSPRNGSEKSFSGLMLKKLGQESEELIVPPKIENLLQSMELEVKDNSPVSVHNPWSSGPSSPSSNSLLGNVVR
ncbi:hypothetical protein TSUD_233000 [Trifolium subterraneum]|uniref:EGF-like domain-containing protein n=1 Tax=Trifolium subterraneum TaxID=3900 RepID=A0A2Z6LJ88_TRISU|nr:hypothetical protein TSUD_233000 [Trifolium subterraneum]